MPNKNLLRPEIASFIYENRKKDLPALILKGSPFPDVSVQELARQIKGVKIAEKKFPEFYQNRQILYPPKLNLEQTSSQITAEYKASLVKGNKGIDLTGGMGIDSYYLSRKFEDFTYCELDEELTKLASHNFSILKANNIQVVHADSLNFLKTEAQKFDLVYADPARRDEKGGKVFKLKDCVPDIPSNLAMIFEHTNSLLLKTSPMLDISIGLEELEHVREIHIVAVKNEVRELLWLLDKSATEDPIIKTVNFEKNEVQELNGSLDAQNNSLELSLPLKFLYEPNAAIMKSGLFERVAAITNTTKLHQNSHLYTSEEKLNFPGRIFQITEIEEYKPGNLKRKLKNQKANITTRNFPESVEDLRKKFKIKDGGSDYFFFTTNMDDEKIMISCRKV